MNTRRICVWTGPLGQTDGLMRTLTSLPEATGLRDPLSKAFVQLTGAREAAPQLSSATSEAQGLLVMRSPAAHAIGIDLRRFKHDLHIFFLQHPDERLPALTQAVVDPDWQERAYTWQEKLYIRLKSLGADCLVLEANQWRHHPIEVLNVLAFHLHMKVKDFRPVIPQSETCWRGEAFLHLGFGPDLRQVCLDTYRRMVLQSIQDFPVTEASAIPA